MPGSMIHLIVAKKVRPNASDLFYLGNIAPDTVNDWRMKDITHFRNLENREPALINLAKESYNDFNEGMLLHLYFDWKWDTIVREKFIEQVGEDWFSAYRKEISRIGSYAFHHIYWAKELWNNMDSVAISDYCEVPYATSDELKDFVHRNNVWHNENIREKSDYFSPELIDAFTTQVAKEFIEWTKTNSNLFV